MKFEIMSRSGRVLFSAEAASQKRVVQNAVASGANLSGADLSGADLYGTDLSGTDLCVFPPTLPKRARCRGFDAENVFQGLLGFAVLRGAIFRFDLDPWDRPPCLCGLAPAAPAIGDGR